MGCTPSHSGIVQSIARNAAKPLKKNKALLPPDLENNVLAVSLSDNKNEHIKQKEGLQKENHQKSQLEKNVSDSLVGLSHNGSLSDNQGKYEKLATADEGMVNLTYQKRRTIRKHSSTGSEQEMPGTLQLDGNSRRNRKSKSQRLGKHSRRAKTNQAVFLDIEKKVDFPEELVKAHQDAYTFLNPNLSKYEAVISMANQATQTHLIMQQMMSFMALRFDHINQCLEEIAEDGEKLLKAVGSNLTWPFGKGNPAEQPDLLQQLLQYTINKMETLNGTVSSLTTNALQDTCGFLQSTVDKFQEKLKQKEQCDERLLRMIKSLEGSAAGSTQQHPNDTTLYSEDSGIGGDSESMRGYRSPDKMGRMSSIDSTGQASSATGEVAPPQMSTNKVKTSDLNLNLKSTSAQKENTNHSSGAQKSDSSVSEKTSISSSPSMSSLGTTATVGEDGTLDPESEESTSSDESCDESEDNKSLASQITLTQRPLTSPAGMGPYKYPSKWLENPENEEMTLKMKEAISEKIKFVPGKSSSNVWTREEVNTDMVRPNSADGSNRRTSNQRRSRSAESLRSQAEDPTLLELQRTQKELSKKLELLYSSTKDTTQNPNIKSFSHAGCIIPNNSSTNKLKACLAKSFNILPSQEGVARRKIDTNVARDSNSKPKTKVLDTSLNPHDAKAEEKFLVEERKLESINASPRQSVQKLIQTFSPVGDPIKNRNMRTLGPLRCVQKFGIPVLPPTISFFKGLHPLDIKSHVFSTGEETTTDTNAYVSTSTLTTDSFISSKPYDAARAEHTESGTEDYENLPPPPLEILMDDSFNLLSDNEHEKYTSFTCTMKPPVSQKMKNSVNIKNVLPSKNITDLYMFKDRACRKEDLVNNGLTKYSLQSDQLSNNKELCMDLQKKHEIEQAANLYKQSHKIIHLQNPGDGEVMSPDKDNNKPCYVASMVKPKLYSPTLQRNEILRKHSPTRVAASSPPTDRKLTSPPTIRNIQKTHYSVQQPSSMVQKTSSTSTPRVSSPPNGKMLASPPTQRKLPSPPSQRKLSSPPQVGRQQSPPSQRRLPSPPQIRRQQSPPSQHRQSSSPQMQRHQSPPSHHRQPSPPQIQKQSPPSQCRLPSPPQIRGQQSPPSQHRQSSPPQLRKQQSPPSQRRLPSPPQIRNKGLGSQQSPPSHRRLPSPPQTCEPRLPSYSTPSPPVSPSHTGLRRSSEDQQPSSKIIGNAQSIFCPSSSSLFEAKPPSPPGTSRPEAVLNEVQSPVLRHTFSVRQYDDQHRRLAMSAANPQPFVRRSYSDRRPRVQLLIPTSKSANAVSQMALQQTSVEESTQKDSEPAASQGLTDPRAAGQAAAKSELCVVGQGLQKE
ncbi:photoreceptor cilium actin regulator [Rhinoderma darwinii]|uniref:photoreceptor cilium actin regulator n=1 Tax=Rhinoderma darwinii TaxID=43563 RepID=UPI003F675114